MDSWTRSKAPCAARAVATIQSDDRNPIVAAAMKTPPISASRTSACVDAPIAANSEYSKAITIITVG
jgi:hypothetical protein